MINRFCTTAFLALGSAAIALSAVAADLIPYEKGSIPDSDDYAGYPGYDSDQPPAAMTPEGRYGDPGYRPGYESDRLPAPIAPNGAHDRYSYQPRYDSGQPPVAMAPDDRYQEGYESGPPLSPPPAYNDGYNPYSGNR
ncbi:MAG: hypothetical protein WBW08_08645 [Methyloceanibacter sp.]